MLDMKQIESFYPEALRPFKKNLLREYIQYKILEAMFNSEFGNSLAFMGGTAIHIMHGNTRFSEDLDFDNLGLTAAKFRQLADVIKMSLKREGYIIKSKVVLKGAYTVYLKIPELLYDNKLSDHKEEILLIKVDAEPQKFKYKPDKTIINKFDVFLRVNVVPADTLLSQKIYAIFNRRRPVGRDFYDAIFLLGKTKPNFRYLKSKLGTKDDKELKDRILRKCGELDFKQLDKDVEPFLYTPGDARKILLFSEYFG